MRKSIVKISIGLISIILFIVFLLNYKTESSLSEHLRLIKSDSYFFSFEIDESTVYIKCNLTIANQSNDNLHFQLFGLAPNDVSLGLLKQEHLKCINLERGDDQFYIRQKEKKSFIVIFTGEFGGIAKKYDRLIPDVRALEIII